MTRFRAKGSALGGLDNDVPSLLFETPDPHTPKTAKICAILVGARCQIFGQLLALKILGDG